MSFTSVAIGQSNYFGFGFTTLNWKPVYFDGDGDAITDYCYDDGNADDDNDNDGGSGSGNNDDFDDGSFVKCLFSLTYFAEISVIY